MYPEHTASTPPSQPSSFTVLPSGKRIFEHCQKYIVLFVKQLHVIQVMIKTPPSFTFLDGVIKSRLLYGPVLHVQRDCLTIALQLHTDICKWEELLDDLNCCLAMVGMYIHTHFGSCHCNPLLPPFHADECLPKCAARANNTLVYTHMHACYHGYTSINNQICQQIVIGYS